MVSKSCQHLSIWFFLLLLIYVFGYAIPETFEIWSGYSQGTNLPKKQPNYTKKLEFETATLPELFSTDSHVKKTILANSTLRKMERNVLHGEGFETDYLTEKLYLYDFNGNGSRPCFIQKKIVRNGKKASTCGISHPNGGFRSELVLRGPNPKSYRHYFTLDYEIEYWLGWSLYLPADYPIDDTPEIYAQMHNPRDAGEEWKNPSWALGTNGNDSLHVINRWDEKKITPSATSGIPRYTLTKFWTIGKVSDLKGRWTDFVLKAVWSHKKQGNGFFRLWMNGNPVLTYKGPNCFYDKTGPYFKVGIYKWIWNSNQTLSAVHNKREISIDELYLAKYPALFADVAANISSDPFIYS